VPRPIYGLTPYKMRTIASIVLLALCTNIYSQSSINSGGTTATNHTGSISYSIGQTFVHITENTTNTVHRGVQQPIRTETETTSVETQCIASLQVFPNPVTNKLHITHEWQSGDVVELFDMNGRRVFSTTVGAGFARPDGNIFTIDMTPFPNGTYILRIGTRVAKIIKH